MSVHFSSLTDLWPTPQATFDALDREFGFETDVCAIASNAKCDRYFTPEIDGLAQSWRGVCWMNPPYGRGISKWMKKAHESSLTGATVVCLVPARTDTAWWHDYAMKGEIRFIRGRLQFNGVKDAPFPSAVVIFAAQGIAAGTDETLKAAQPVGQEPGPKDAPKPFGPSQSSGSSMRMRSDG